MRVVCSTDPELPGTTIATVSGSLDLNGAESFLASVMPNVGAESPSLIVDLSEVEWVSSAGVGALVRLLTRTQSVQGGFALHGCRTRVLNVLRICGLEKPLNVREDASAARAHLHDRKSG
jgi:anti-anti-sigma factor